MSDGWWDVSDDAGVGAGCAHGVGGAAGQAACRPAHAREVKDRITLNI